MSKLILYFCINIIFFVASAFADDKINGILIEGMDYSGKTTIAELLYNTLKSRGIQTQSGHGQIMNSSVESLLIKKAFESFPSEISNKFPDKGFISQFNHLRTAQFIVDINLLENFNQNNFLVMDRYWFSQECRNKFFDEGKLNQEMSWIKKNLKPFKYNVYLHCNKDAREERAQKRDNVGKSNNLDKYMSKHFEKLDQLDKFCMNLISKDESWLIIDTSDIDPRKNPEKILNQILPFMGIK